MTYLSIGQAFNDYLDFLKVERGISIRTISKTINVPESKLHNIRRNKSTANKEMLDNLLRFYPELKRQESNNFAEHDKIKDLEERMRQLEQQMLKVLNQLDTLKS